MSLCSWQHGYLLLETLKLSKMNSLFLGLNHVHGSISIIFIIDQPY